MSSVEPNVLIDGRAGKGGVSSDMDFDVLPTISNKVRILGDWGFVVRVVFSGKNRNPFRTIVEFSLCLPTP